MIFLSVFEVAFQIISLFFVLQVKIWDPSLRGSELRATLKGHTR
jgi:hypothetical protein